MLEVEALSRPGLLGPVSFSLKQGACGVIMGASGSGKSLLARAIVDLDPNEGVVRLGGRSRAAMPAWRWRRLVAYVPAQAGWWSERTAEHFPDDAPARPALPGWLEALGLPPDILRRPVAQLSSGERQRLALVRALIMAPEVLIADEPTSALDEAGKRRVEEVLRALLEEGLTVVLITHDPAQARRLGDAFWRMEAGRLFPLPATEVEAGA